MNRFLDKLKEKAIPAVSDILKESDIVLVESERLEYGYVYFEDVEEDSTSGFPIGVRHYVGVVSFEKETGDYVGFVEIRQAVDRKTKKGVTTIPWMFLNRSDILGGVEKRGKGYMKEMLLTIVPELRRAVPFYENEKIHSGTSLSEQAVSFFEKLVNEGLAKKLKKDDRIFGKIPYELTF